MKNMSIQMSAVAILLVFIGSVITIIHLDWLHHFTLIIIYGLPVIFIACGLGAGTIYTMSFFSDEEFNNKTEAIVLCVISVFIGVAMIKAFWGVYP